MAGFRLAAPLPLSLCLLLVALLGPAALVGCADDPAAPELTGDNLLELVTSAEDLGLIREIVGNLAVSGTLRSGSDLTFFAPTDEALLSLGTEMLARLRSPDNEAILDKLVRRHIVPGRFRLADLRDGMTLNPIEGPPLAVRVDGEDVTVGGALITDDDFATGNGVLFQVDEVVRDHLTLAERLRVTPIISTFADALATAELTDEVTDGEPYTLLIPINSAFVDLDEAEFQSLLQFQNRDLLLKVLRHHILPGRVRAEQLVDGSSLMPLDGTPLAVEFLDNQTYLGGSRIVVPEVETSDGLIYLLDTVVLSHLDLTERLRISPQHTLFYRILEGAGLLDQLREETPLTLFAPTDATLESLGTRFLPELSERPDLLLRTAQYQVVPGLIDREALLGGGTLTTLGGYDLPVSTVSDGNEIKVFLGRRGAVNLPPKHARNGLLYSFSPFLIPPGLNLEERIIFAGLYRFLDLVQEAGLTSLLHETGPYTVLAPDDDALAGQSIPPSEIQQIVRYHFVSGYYEIDDLTPSSPSDTLYFPTLAGSEIRTTFSAIDGLFIDDARPVSPNNVATNGVIHGLDRVLSPPNP